MMTAVSGQTSVQTPVVGNEKVLLVIIMISWENLVHLCKVETSHTFSVQPMRLV